MDGLILPPAAWREREGLAGLCRVLGVADGEVRYVGGAVRDALLGIAVADVDLATRLQPAEVIARLEAAAIRAVPTGLAHGTVTAILASGPVEVTTLRHDLETDGRHATVAFTTDWQEDAARRDFTINALYADPLSGALHDYFGGLADLADRRVRFIGDPYQRIAEDHLRILRFFRFHARFGDSIDAEGLEACAERANDLMALSRERIASELLRLLVAPNAVSVVERMIERGIFRPVLPEIAQAGLDRLVRTASREAATRSSFSAVTRLASLLPDGAQEDVASRLRLSRHDRVRMTGAVEALPTLDATELVYRIGSVAARDRLLLADLPDAAVLPMLAEIERVDRPVLPLTGGAIVSRGVDRGPDVARLLREVEEAWIAEGFPDRARVDHLADVAVQDFRRRSII